MRGPRPTTVFWCVLFVGATALAQERGFAIHRGDSTIAGSSTFLVERPWYSDERPFAVGLTADYGHRVLVPRLAEGVPPVLKHALLGRLDLAGSLFDRVTLFGSAPLSLLERGTAERLSQTAPAQGPGLGDPRVGLFVRLFGHASRDAFSLHLGAEVWVPIGAAATHQGDLGVRVMPKAVLAGTIGWFQYSLEGGYLHRPYASFGPPSIGVVSAPEVRGGAALGLSLFDDRLTVGPEARFAMQVQGEKALRPEGTSLELLGGARLLIAQQLSVGLAGGTGLFGMAGTPDLRGFLRVAWTPLTPHETDAVLELPPSPPDADADGVPDQTDRCPFEPETLNGVRDRDGCPEFVRDDQSSLVRLLVEPASSPSRSLDAGAPSDVPVTVAAQPDAGASSAPLVADGGMFQLEVMLDSDGDGQPDDVDRCPVTKEDVDGFEDDDGCPEADNDGDGIKDAADQCALEAETFNATTDDDGCPDVASDLDKDSIADAIDRCPYEPETLDGLRDDDGCPEFVNPGKPTAAALMSALDAAVRSGGKPGDLDRDTINDAEDRCPLSAEDRDGFEDDDGCPESDNDEDGIADARDRCPEAAETIDSYQDDDGCPDERPDADGDGLDFPVDRCPLEPGDSSDGCPHLPPPLLALADVKLETAPKPTSAPPKPFAAADFDKDGIVDDDDRCPVSKEDADAFEDDDGCPEVDNDRDGVDDGKDKCPFEAETINGNADDDGCPDPGSGVVTVTKDAVVINGIIQFKTASATLQPSATPLLKQVAATLKAYASLSIEIQGHTDDVGNAAKNIALSKKRAETIRAFLVKSGVSTKRLVAKGFGPTKPRASNKTAAGREQNRRVEFLILGEAK